MTVKELIDMLSEANPDAKVTACDLYSEGEFNITGMIYNDDGVELTGENTE